MFPNSPLPSHLIRPSLHLSKLCPETAEKIREESIHEGVEYDSDFCCFVLKSSHPTLILPDLSQYSNVCQRFILSDLVDNGVNKSLLESNLICWNEELTKLLPLRTTGDGNCLLHAASIAIWGIHDRDLSLRNALHKTFLEHSLPFYNVWKSEQQKILNLDEETLQDIWSELINSSRIKPSKVNDGRASYEYLERIHIFALCHILRRPIIIYSKVISTSILERMDGIYIPLLGTDVSKCEKEPIILGYAENHFSPLIGLVNNQNDRRICKIPLVDNENNILPIHFASETNEDTIYEYLIKYFRLEYTEKSKIMVAIQTSSQQSQLVTDLLSSYVRNCVQTQNQGLIKEFHSLLTTSKPCRNTECDFIGSSQTNGFCINCYRNFNDNICLNQGCTSIKKNSNSKYCIYCESSNFDPFVLKPCKNSNCSLFSKNQFCSQCYSDSNSNLMYSNERDSILKCHNLTCNRIGFLLLDGYCDCCYKTQQILGAVFYSQLE